MSDTLTRYTCNDYRDEMLLVKLRIELSRNDLTETERKRIEKEIERIEKRMGMD